MWRIGRAFAVGDYERSLRTTSLPAADAIYTQSLEFGLAYRRLNSGTPIIAHTGHVLAHREAEEESALGQPWKAIDVRLADSIEQKGYRSGGWQHIVSTRLVAETRSKHFGLRKGYFKVRPLGVDVARFSDVSERAITREQLGIGIDECVVVVVARLVKWKNIDWLIRAVPALPDNVHVLIVGDGPEKSALRAQLPASDSHRVHFVGHQNPVRYLAAGDIFALPSAIESFGIAYAEAMSMGLPCIGLRYSPPEHLSSAEEVVESGISGVVVSTETEFQMILKDLCSDVAKRTAMGEAAKLRARAFFSVDAYAQFLETVIEDKMSSDAEFERVSGRPVRA